MDLITTKKRKDLPRPKRKRLVKILKGEDPQINHQRKEVLPNQKKELEEGDPHQERQIGFHVSISKKDIAIMATNAIFGTRHFASISKKENVTREISVHSCILKVKKPPSGSAAADPEPESEENTLPEPKAKAKAKANAKKE